MSDEYLSIISQEDFRARARTALVSPKLQGAMRKARTGFTGKRTKALKLVPNFDAMRDRAREVRLHSLASMDTLLTRFEARVTEAGGHVHWAETPQDVRRIVIDICQRHGARSVTKGKSMISEEADLGGALSREGIVPHETDLGEYIVQLAAQPPSHIIAPAVHVTRDEVVGLFRRAHEDLGERDLSTIKAIVDEARTVIRQRYLDADVGITGANALIADTGTAMLVTNEGNGDLTAALPKAHIVTASIEKVVENWDDASAILRVLARSATGQAMSVYTSFYSAPRDDDPTQEFHVVLLDNRRSELLSGKYREMLLCIRCGACMNHCPVYQNVGGHAYGSVYPGPMGAVLTPLLRGDPGDFDLPNASSFCGRCEAVCPVRIPLPDLLRNLRNDQHDKKQSGRIARLAVSAFVALARRPAVYRRFSGTGAWFLARLAGAKGRLERLPFAGAWTRHRDLPAPEGKTFQHQWRGSRR